MKIFVFLSLIVFIPGVHAAPSGQGGVEVRLLAESAPLDLGQISLVTEKERTEPFDLPINNLSAPQKPAARAFKVWAVAKNVSLAAVTLPEVGKSFIVLLIPSPTGGYSPVVMNSGDPSFRPGDIYFHNHADKTVLGFVGTSKFTLAPAHGTIVRPKGAKPEKFYDVGLGVREPEGDRVLCTMRWPEDDLERVYVFFYLNPNTKRIAYRAVNEFVEKSEVAP